DLVFWCVIVKYIGFNSHGDWCELADGLRYQQFATYESEALALAAIRTVHSLFECAVTCLDEQCSKCVADVVLRTYRSVNIKPVIGISNLGNHRQQTVNRGLGSYRNFEPVEVSTANP